MTETPGAAATATPPRCCGDLNADHVVSDWEASFCVAILGGNPIEWAPDCDCNRDGYVFGNDITIIVTNQTSGCSATPTPTTAPYTC